MIVGFGTWGLVVLWDDPFSAIVERIAFGLEN